ncbi:MAG: hypothetical protein RL754_418, partial [Bacteroidota bacterium]
MHSVSAYGVDRQKLEDRLLALSGERSFFSLLTSRGVVAKEGAYDLVFGWGAKRVFSADELMNNAHQGQMVFGALSYELRHKFERYSDGNRSILDWPQTLFFVPEVYGFLDFNGQLELFADTEDHAETVLSSLQEERKVFTGPTALEFHSVETKEEYVDAVQKLQAHIQRGDIYEVNYCTAFEATYEELDREALFQKMVKATEAPFSAFFKASEYELLCTSPERNIRKLGSRLISQPIKGTNARTNDNDRQRSALLESEKERAENVMIVDLVRNDLSRVAAKGSVHVSELFGVYSFKNVNQLISTVEAEIKPTVSLWSVLEATFPMGSMTGAPKVSAVELAERYEKTA